MKQVIFLTGMLFLCIQLYAQSVISGVVIDNNGSPVEFANVVLIKDSLFVTGVITDSRGVFEISHPFNKSNHIEISMIGYESRSLDIPITGNCGTIVLREVQMVLDEVVVKAKSRPATRLRGGTLVTKIENSVLSKMGTAADVLVRLPLVRETDGKYTVFGKGTPLIYINGKQMRNVIELQQLRAESIRSVEVITNPGAQYPSDVQSVMRIKTIPRIGEGFSADLYNATRVSYFVRNMSDFSFNYRHNRLDFFIDGYFDCGKRHFTDNAEMVTTGDKSLCQLINTRSVRKFNDVSGKMGVNYQISDEQSIGAYYSLGREHSLTRANPESQIDLYSTGGFVSSESISSHLSSRSTSQPVHEFNFYYNGEMGKFNIDFNADFTQKRTENYDIHEESGSASAKYNRHIVSEGLKKSRLFAEKLVVSRPVWSGNIEIGEEYTNSLLNYGYIYDGLSVDDSFTEIREDNFAVFATISQTLGVFNLSAGVRHEHVKYKYLEKRNLSNNQSKDYNNIFPTFSVDAILGKVKLSFSFANRILRPSYQQLDGGIRYVNNFAYQCGNPKLRPVNRYTVQMAGMWKWLFAQASVNHEANSIFWVTMPYGGDSHAKLLSFENVSRYTQLQFAVGAQLSFGCLKPQPTVGMIKQFYSTSHSGVMLNFAKPLYSFTLNNTISLSKGWTLGADFRFTTQCNMKNTSMSSTNKVDLMIRKSFLDGNLVVAIYAEDLFDGSVARTTMYSGNIVTKLYNRAEQRNIRFTLRYKFNSARSKYRGTGAGEVEKDRM